MAIHGVLPTPTVWTDAALPPVLQQSTTNDKDDLYWPSKLNPFSNADGDIMYQPERQTTEPEDVNKCRGIQRLLGAGLQPEAMELDVCPTTTATGANTTGSVPDC